MPTAIPVPGAEVITKFTNCRLLRGDQLVNEDLWISSLTGKIIRSQQAFYENHITPHSIIDLGGRILSPGLIDVQLNGAFGFDFSVIPDGGQTEYAKTFREVNKRIVETGVTAYLPTLTSQRREVYHQALPFLGPSGAAREAADGAESLGAHCEGPFLAPTKNGIHKVSVLRAAVNGFDDIEDMYGTENIVPQISPLDGTVLPPRIKKITAAPEIAAMRACIPELTKRGIVFSMGHTEATYEDATEAISLGCTMVTHMFNAMKGLHHRNPGVFGTLGRTDVSKRPFFGVIADGIHLHPTSVKIAWKAHSDGFILVTDAMHLVGLPDGVYDWTNGERIVKQGPRLVLEGSDKIAGSSITLIECVTNFLNWSSATVPQALKAVTATPAALLGLGSVKGSLDSDADADLVVIDELTNEDGSKKLVIDEVWKFGTKVYDRLENAQD